MQLFFKQVHVCKPRSSRDSSIESFIVCRQYTPPPDYTPTMKPFMDLDYNPENPLVGINRIISPFVACGDLSGYDADMTYPLPENAVSLEPIQKPIDPPYKTFLQMKLSK